jgi:N6-adenosine-specific RNA methylase IME4
MSFVLCEQCASKYDSCHTNLGIDELCKKHDRTELNNFNVTEHPMLHGVPSDEFSVIMVDPPFRNYGQLDNSNNVDGCNMTVSDDELFALPVGKIAATSSLLLLWCNGTTMPRAVALCKAWGFEYKTVTFVWVETDQEPESSGFGHFTEPGTKFLLLATKGDGSSLIVERLNQASTRTEHAKKPHEIRNVVDTITGHDCKLRKLELYSHTEADTKWSAWGPQISETSKMQNATPNPEPYDHVYLLASHVLMSKKQIQEGEENQTCAFDQTVRQPLVHTPPKSDENDQDEDRQEKQQGYQTKRIEGEPRFQGLTTGQKAALSNLSSYEHGKEPLITPCMLNVNNQ